MSILRGERCANCGRAVGGLDDARKEGRRWYCSQSCFLQASSVARPGRARRRREGGPVRRVWRAVKWTLLVLGVLFVALIVAAIAGLGDTKDKTSAQVRQVRVAKVKPVRLGRGSGVGAGWRLRILSVNWNADAAIASTPGQYGGSVSAPHAQDVMLTIVARFAGGGQSFASMDLGGRIFVIGRHRARYPLTSGLNDCGPGEAKLPPPDAQAAFELDRRVYSGTVLRGHICFQVARNDARSLRLGVSPVETLNGKRGRTIWFALR
jgi:hypothetical protein